MRSSDPFAKPIIRANYLTDVSDVDAFVEGVALARRFGESRTYDHLRGEEIELRLTAPVAERLQPGEFLRVAREADGRFRVRCVYPPETARLGEIA